MNTRYLALAILLSVCGLTGANEADEESQPLLIIDENDTVEDALDVASQIIKADANASIAFDQYGGVADAAGDPAASPNDDSIVTVMQQSQQALHDKRVEVFGSDKAIRISELRAVDMPSYSEWQDQQFMIGLNDVGRVSENEQLLRGILESALPPENYPGFSQCSSDICLVHVTEPQLDVFLEALRAKEVRFADAFMQPFGVATSANGLLEMVFIREDVDMSNFPGN